MRQMVQARTHLTRGYNGRKQVIEVDIRVAVRLVLVCWCTLVAVLLDHKLPVSSSTEMTS